MIGKISYKQLNAFAKWYPTIEKRLKQNVKKYLEDELSLFKQVLSAIPYLKNYRDESLVFNLYNAAANRFCHNGDYLYRKGDKMKEEMYIIVKGTVSITLMRRGGEEVNLEILQGGTIIGLYGMFDRRRLVYNMKIDSARAMLLVIKKQDMMEILEK